MHLACRSEEHTSERQSRQYLVCRLLLEKTNDVVSESVVRPRAVVYAPWPLSRQQEAVGDTDPHPPSAPPPRGTIVFLFFFFFQCRGAPPYPLSSPTPLSPD